MSTTMTRRNFLKGASVAAAGLALAGCGSSSTSTETAATTTAAVEYDPVTLRVAFMPNLGSASTLFTAIDQGYFDEVGITVETQQFEAGPAEITAMASGDIDLSQIGHGAHALAIEGEAKLFSFEQLSQSDEVVVDKSKISSAADLKGKTIGVTSGTSSEIILQLVLAEAGLTTDDVNLVEMAVANMTTALIAGQIDAAATWSPNTVTLKEQLGDNYLCLGTNTDFSDRAAFPSSFCCIPSYAEENHEILVRFAAALDKAKVYRNDNIEEVAKLLASELGVDEDTMVQSTGEGDWQGSVDAIGDTDVIRGYYEAQQQVFIDNGRITEAVDVDDYVLFDVIEEADALYETLK